MAIWEPQKFFRLTSISMLIWQLAAVPNPLIWLVRIKSSSLILTMRASLSGLRKSKGYLKIMWSCRWTQARHTWLLLLISLTWLSSYLMLMMDPSTKHSTENMIRRHRYIYTKTVFSLIIQQMFTRLSLIITNGNSLSLTQPHLYKQAKYKTKVLLW